MPLKCSIIGLLCPTISQCEEPNLKTTLCWFGLDIDFSRSTSSEVHSSKYDAGFRLAPLLLLTPAVQTAKHHTAVFLQLSIFLNYHVSRLLFGVVSVCFFFGFSLFGLVVRVVLGLFFDSLIIHLCWHDELLVPIRCCGGCYCWVN